MAINKYHSGDYIRYEMKNELGKVKRIAGENDVFAWFHTGDTAARISSNLFTVILSCEKAEKMSKEELVSYLNRYDFSNAYAIEGIIEHCS